MILRAEAGTLHDAFIDELRDSYDGEKQLTKALAKLAKAATSPQLREAFEAHLEETRGQIERLETKREPMVVYAQTALCRTHGLLEALGETMEQSQCGTCDNCRSQAVRSEAVAAGAA